MKTNKVNRHAPLALGNERSLRNRVVVPPMASQTADAQGLAQAATLAHYDRLSLAGAGLVIVEYAFVHASGRSEARQLGIASEAHLPGLRGLAQAIQRTGALAGIQLTHAGGKTERALAGGALMAPSSIAVPVKDRQMEIPDAMAQKEIELWKSAFAAAADRAATAGFDLVELHSAHGYGLNQWLSPLTNQRADEYGGDLFGRTRLLLEIVELIRKKHAGLLLSVRIPGQDFFAGGLNVANAVEVALALERAGADIIHVSSGIGGWKRPLERRGEGYLVAEAADVQAAVHIPVVGVGGIESGSYIDQSLRARRFSLAAVGRAILQDPGGWGRNNL
jgi:NADPH2 dehydrogenase